MSVGPLFLDISGTQLTEEDKSCIADPNCGGLILFTRNFESAEQLFQLTKSIKQINSNILIAVDQEGGRVQRFKNEFTELPFLSVLGDLYIKEPEKALKHSFQFAQLMALEVLSVGCDFSFTPVLDLGLKESKVIGKRAFSDKIENIIPLAAAFLDGMKMTGMASTGKHFPGHGSVTEDSHLTIPYDDRDIKTIENNDMKSFIKLKSQLSAMMPAHIIYPKIDHLPAGFSKIWITDYLRKKLQFDKVIISDDLSMKGAEIVGNYTQRMDKALTAGCDLVLLCNNREQAIKMQYHLKDYRSSNESQCRIKRMKADPKLAIGLKKLKQTQRWKELNRAVLTLS